MHLHTTKYDGSLHYRFVVDPVFIRPGLLAVHLPLGGKIDSYRFQGRACIEPGLGLCWPDRHYNVWIKWRQDWTPIHYYVNVATPASWEAGTLRYVDLDLDLILPADGGTPILDDADEFALHRERFGYPPDLVETCLATSVEVAAMMRRREWPFDGRLFDWRPGRPIPGLEDLQSVGR